MYIIYVRVSPGSGHSFHSNGPFQLNICNCLSRLTFLQIELEDAIDVFIEVLSKKLVINHTTVFSRKQQNLFFKFSDFRPFSALEGYF